MLLFLLIFLRFFKYYYYFLKLLSKAYHYEIYITKQYVVMLIVHDVVYAISYHS